MLIAVLVACLVASLVVRLTVSSAVLLVTLAVVMLMAGLVVLSGVVCSETSWRQPLPWVVQGPFRSGHRLLFFSRLLWRVEAAC